MASDLAFALLGPGRPVASPLTTSSVHAPSGISNLGQRTSGIPATGLGVSATLAAIVGRALQGRKGRKVELRAIADINKDNPFRNEVGAMEPLGFWDPLHLTREGFKNPEGAYKSQDTFDWYRMAELKHGRISMLAITGYFFGTFAKWPGFEDVPGGMMALDTSLGGAGLGAIILAAGIFEIGILKQDPAKNPGDLGDPLGLSQPGLGSYTTQTRNQEIAHCRLAMSGIIYTFIYEYAGVTPFSQFNGELNVWGASGLLVVFSLWFIGIQADQFYIADDSSGKPAYLPALQAGGEAPKMLGAAVQNALPAAAVAAAEATAAAADSVLEKKGGKYRFAAE